MTINIGLPISVTAAVFHCVTSFGVQSKMFVLYLPSILGPDFMFRLPVMADTITVTLGLIGWASVSMTTTIWAVWRETLWKDSARALTLLALPRAEV